MGVRSWPEINEQNGSRILPSLNIKPNIKSKRIPTGQGWLQWHAYQTIFNNFFEFIFVLFRPHQTSEEFTSPALHLWTEHYLKIPETYQVQRIRWNASRRFHSQQFTIWRRFLEPILHPVWAETVHDWHSARLVLWH